MTIPQQTQFVPGGQRSVFLSYARADKAALRVLTEGIDALHYRVWIDGKLDGGQAWWDEILGNIRNCDVMVVAVSPALLESEAAASERDYARRLGKPLIPVIIAPVMSDLLPPDIASLQFIDFTNVGPMTGFYLASALSALRPTPPLPDPLPPPPRVPVTYMAGIADKLRAASLSLDEQRVLVAQLRDSLARPRQRDAAVELLHTLADRHDLFHATGQEIDRLLQIDWSRAQTAPGPAMGTTPGFTMGTGRASQALSSRPAAREAPGPWPQTYAAASGPKTFEAQTLPAPARPRAHWPLSIVALLLFFPLGGFGLYFSSQVTGRWNTGNAAGARSASKTALIVDWIGIAIWLLILFSVLANTSSSGY
ncbi:TIR domain-containing protein [Arthrobacter sp. A5]|uniref:TIR domain-containing protein n=1 Tax=Arthrobacter sp. A5 TaxID=576926 RepID=UPI003DA7C754